ncbi:MAG TPA: hypothetical protein VLE70_19810, partial [Anaerolineae bacterium]|nr:hypothetical protein [Anaerolineae bacterium]
VIGFHLAGIDLLYATTGIGGALATEAWSDGKSETTMKRCNLIFLLALVILGVAQVACQPSLLVPEAQSPEVSVLGLFRPWTAETPVADRRVALCGGLGDPRDGLCTLMEDSVTTDRQGRFQFYDVPAGIYFLLYDSGLSDFDEALAKWGGKTLHFGDQEWLSEFLEVDLSDDDFEYRIPEGISFSPQAGWLSSYCLLTLLVGESPFIIAHDLEQASHDRELHCALVNVLPDQPAKVDIQVLYLGKQ